MTKKVRDQIRIRADGTSERRIGNKVSYGMYGPVQEGKPLTEGAELLDVAHDSDDEGWRDVKVLYKHTSGPAQVATPAYREGYDRIFGKQKVGQA